MHINFEKMKLSFNIPTYNRAKYLKKNLEILTAQIIELHKEDDVEINISDNASYDNTKEISEYYIATYPQLNIRYHCNDKNLGPDTNFINAMHLANGEYSLLWGDDDFLKDDGLARIFELIDYGQKNNIQIMLSSTSLYDSKGNYKSEKLFLREDIDELTIDFSDIIQVRAYFYLLKDMGGMLSFISDVIYKTSIINKIEFSNDYIGTHYAFLCYWWGWLAKGNKLYYSSKSFLKETIQYQPAYGFGVKRTLVDFHGYNVILNVSLKDSAFKNDFKAAFLNLHPDIKMRQLLIAEPHSFKKDILPKMLEFKKDSNEVTLLLQSSSFKRIIKELLFTITPENIVYFLKNIKLR